MAKTILVVDDSSSLRTVVKMALTRAGYDVLEAGDGRQALAELDKAAKVNLIVSDLNMPNMDGITLVAQLRTLPDYRLVPLLLLTTESSTERKMQGKQAGATGWMVKPFNPEQLLATLSRVLGARASNATRPA